MNRLVPRLRFPAPPLRVGRLAQHVRKVLQVAFVLVQQAVQAHRREVMRRARKRPEAIARIESRLAHRPVALVKIVAQPVPVRPRVHAHMAHCHIATGLLQSRRFRRIRMLRPLHQKSIAARMRVREQPPNHVGIIRAVIGHLRHRPLAVVVVARQAGRSRAMLGPLPRAVVLLRNRIRMLQPRLRFRAALPESAQKLFGFSYTARIIEVRNGGCERVRWYVRFAFSTPP